MIFVDASRYNNTPHRTGVENYSFHLINALAKLAPEQTTLVSPRRVPLDVPQLILPFPRLWTQVRLSCEVLLSSRGVRRRGATSITPDSTLFVPSHQMPIVHPANTVITIHDVAFKRFPECYSLLSRLYLDWGARFACKSAKKIIVPSQVTKDDLIKWYKCDPAKVMVIPHGYSPLSVTLSAAKSPPVTNHPYFLFLGRIERKKNLLTLIQAFNQFHQTNPEWKLALAGKPGVGSYKILAATKQNSAIELLGYVNEAVKIELLKNASAFIFPSLYEGFGFPLLEAMEFNLPIIASDIHASREVAGEAALFFDPSSIEELISQMTRVANNPPPTNAYTQILARYSWEECAKKTLNVLKNHIQ
ncbi:MAG: glycosyltransferase family 1 protein [Candidatus Peregrinibacteria bacterium]